MTPPPRPSSVSLPPHSTGLTLRGCPPSEPHLAPAPTEPLFDLAGTPIALNLLASRPLPPPAWTLRPVSSTAFSSPLTSHCSPSSPSAGELVLSHPCVTGAGMTESHPASCHRTAVRPSELTGFPIPLCTGLNSAHPCNPRLPGTCESGLICKEDQMKMGPNAVTGVLMRRGKSGHRHTWGKTTT